MPTTCLSNICGTSSCLDTYVHRLGWAWVWDLTPSEPWNYCFATRSARCKLPRLLAVPHGLVAKSHGFAPAKLNISPSLVGRQVPQTNLSRKALDRVKQMMRRFFRHVQFTFLSRPYFVSEGAHTKHREAWARLAKSLPQHRADVSTSCYLKGPNYIVKVSCGGNL